MTAHRLALAAAIAFMLAAPARASGCATSLDELRELLQMPHATGVWEETTMRDGKPMIVTLAAREGALHLRFVKSQDGLWAQGPAQVCRHNGEIQARIVHALLEVGAAAPWLVRQSLAHGARFVLEHAPGGALRITTPGWSGEFLPRGAFAVR